MHEVGHALGLDHSNNYDSIMYHTYVHPIEEDGSYKRPTLSEEDIIEIQKIYGKNFIFL